MTERISAPVARSLGSRTHRGRWDRSCRGIMVACASHARSLAQVLEKWAPIFRSWGTGCGGRRHARARHAAPDQAERDTTPHGSFSALDLEAAACCVTVLAGAAAWQHRIRDIKGRNRVDRWRSFSLRKFWPEVARGGIEYDDNLHFICCAASFRLLRQPAANHGADGLADRRAGRDGGDLKSSRSCTHRLALPFVAEPQQRHQHEGKGSEGGRYQNQRRQLVMEQMIEQE
jgi:hypothetical protein